MSLFDRFRGPSIPVQQLTPRQAADRQDLTIVDVRQPEEWIGELGHIAGATLHPLNALVHHIPNHLKKDAPLLLVCRSGARSMMAAQQLAQHGFSQLYNLSGGMMAWNAAGLPVQHTIEDRQRRPA